MKVIRNFQNINQELENTILTLGNFDGIHLGHQAILEQARKIAQDNNQNSETRFKTALLTFEPHPMKITNPSKAENIRISSLGQKLGLIKDNNLVDIVFVANFNQKLANLSAENFVKEVLIDKLKISHLLIGYDFTFGKNRGGNANLLEKMSQSHNFGFTRVLANKNADNEIYSSTRIRELIIDGEVKSANAMLGRNYQISGVIINGKKIARNLGFPTANFLPKIEALKPKYGVYKASVVIEKKRYKAILNFGIKPTFNGNLPLFEVHIFDFNSEIYGKKINVELVDFIRDEKKFTSIVELQEQIRKDCFVAQTN